MAKLSPDEAALLKAVCRNRDDDTPRLVYADWLEEHGRPDRAEFIRLQVEADRDTAWSGRWERDARIKALRDAHAARWLRELPKWALKSYDLNTGRRPAFVRGFVEELELTAAPFLMYGPQLLDRTPIRSLRLTELRNVVDELVSCVWLREVPKVRLIDVALTDADFVELAESEWLAGTVELDLGDTLIGDVGVRALARCRHLAGLRRLALNDTNVMIDGVRVLARSHFLNPDSWFEFHGCPRLEYHWPEVERLFGNRAHW